jgi:predicted nucleotidyltransferase
MRPSEALSERVEAVREVIARYPVANPRLFGSVARGEDDEASDLDLLVDPLAGTTLFDLAGLEMELGALLGIRVEVLTPQGLAPGILADVQNDLRPL